MSFLTLDECIFEECSGTELEHQRTSLMSSATQIPLSRFAFEHLKKGGTPRPTSFTEKKWKEITGDDSLLSVPKTPIAKTGNFIHYFLKFSKNDCFIFRYKPDARQ